MKKFLAAIALIAFTCAPAVAQDAPAFAKKNYPGYALNEAMALMGALGGKESALDAKTQQLISLGVAAQVPCTYCVYFHTRAARAAGATDAEIMAAVAAAADTRMWSTVLNGMAYDFDAFTTEIDKMIPIN